MIGIRIQDVKKRFGNLMAVNSVTLDIEKGEFFTLLGPSGCGKTTLLRCVAGFLEPEGGHIFFGDRRVEGTPTHTRGIGMVFQNYAVFPHLSVRENVKYGLKARKVPTGEQERRSREALAMVQLSGLENRLPNQLSGGQLQRVAIARALVIEPEVLLMDEPLSNLDAKLRVEMRGEIRQLQKTMGITTIYVTHDQEEALSISDRIAVMDHGNIRQIAKPWEIYTRPTDPFVASFIGSTNMLSIEVIERKDNQFVAQCGGVLFGLPLQEGVEPGKRMRISIRPEVFHIALPQDSLLDSYWSLNGRIARIEYLGNMVKYEVNLSDTVNLLVTGYNIEPMNIQQAGDVVRLIYPIKRVLTFMEDTR
jgi:iron(III) transport system ATP-binding protein